MVDGEGTIRIPMDEFYKFIDKYAPHIGGDYFRCYGIPRIDHGCQDLVIDYAFSSECDPEDWAVPPKAVIQIKEDKKRLMEEAKAEEAKASKEESK